MYTFTGLRHSFASDCINIGMDTKSLSEILGHNNIKTTLETYVHSSFVSKKRYLERL
ncbi:MAG: tyrosine-type recombinase/integrase [Clostridia bacterium]|nr:tyrosine-type recombinase/integrase [Clostridia bacterium]